MCVFSVRVLINRGKCRLAIKVDSNVPEEEARVQEVFALVLFVGAHNWLTFTSRLCMRFQLRQIWLHMIQTLPQVSGKRAAVLAERAPCPLVLHRSVRSARPEEAAAALFAEDERQGKLMRKLAVLLCRSITSSDPAESVTMPWETGDLVGLIFKRADKM
jgi:hypothetical protein